MAEVRTTPGIPVALSISGSDSSGGAGTEADLKTFTVLDVFGAVAITAVTAQNTTGIKARKVMDGDFIVQQIDAVAGDMNVGAAKVGMLVTVANVEAVAAAIKRNDLFPLVVDPVMIAKSGDSLIDDDAVKALGRKLLPLAAVVTPNGHEAARLLGQTEPINSVKAAIEAARQICKRFDVPACIVTGVKRPNDEEGEAVDIFFDGSESHEVVSDWRPTDNTHGAGSVFAAAITAALAHHTPLPEAVQLAKAVVSESIRQSTDHGQGHAPVNVLAYAKVRL